MEVYNKKQKKEAPEKNLAHEMYEVVVKSMRYTLDKVSKMSKSGEVEKNQ